MCDDIYKLDDDFLEYINSLPKADEVANSIDSNFEDAHIYESTSIEREVVYNTLADIHDNARVKWNIVTKEKSELDLTQRIDNLDSFLIGLGDDRIMPRYRLDTFLDKLPHGIFDKQVTGVGATTIEINSNRNSIIVLPTKHLAYSKHKLHENTIYIGSGIEEISNALNHVQSYLSNDKYQYKKFLVVADSLGLLIKVIINSKIYNNIYKEFFLMVDEIDLLQDDSKFRPSLESVIDYYFRFDAKNRCLVSATLKEFSNPLFINECRFELTRIEKKKREINLIETDNIVSQIVNIIIATPKDNVLIAYNSIKEALICINLLDDDTKKQCALLCGDSSKTKVGDYYSTLSGEGKLPKRITFMTSAYFVGIDINDDYHLVTITDSLVSHHTLSIAKITQIYGRCRENNTILSDTIICQFKAIEGFRNSPCFYKNYLINKAQKVLELYDALNKIAEQNIGLTTLFERIKVGIREYATERIGNKEDVELTREDIEGNNVIAYLNVDYLIERFNLLKNIYISKEVFEENLKEHNIYITNYQQLLNAPKSAEQKEVEKALSDEMEAKSLKQLHSIIETLNNLEIQGKLTIKDIEYHKRGADKHNEIFLERLMRFYKYLDFHEIYYQLMNVHLKDIRYYKRLNNAIMYWALDDNHPFKLSIRKMFEVGKEYTPKEISTTINDINALHQFKPLAHRTAVVFFNSLFETKRNKIGNYEILSEYSFKFQYLKVRIPSNEILYSSYFIF